MLEINVFLLPAPPPITSLNAGFVFIFARHYIVKAYYMLEILLQELVNR